MPRQGELDDHIHAELSRALFEGRLTPGAKLPEHRLAEIFDVSRERIRKILHRLVAERRLDSILQRGTFVPKPTSGDIRSIYQAHRVFEAGILVQVIQMMDDALTARIEAQLTQERDAALRQDRATSVALSGKFHILLVDALGNPELSRFQRELLARSAQIVSAYEPARLSRCGVDEHEAIFAALKARDTERAIALSREHFLHIEERLAEGIFERSEHDLASVLRPFKAVTKATTRKSSPAKLMRNKTRRAGS